MKIAHVCYNWELGTPPKTVPVLVILGPSRAGKDTAADWLNANTLLTYGGSTSIYLCPYAAAKLGVSEEEAYASRHENRMLWYEIGNQLRQDDPSFFVTRVLENSDMIVGLRSREEVEHLRDTGIADCLIWIENNRIAEGSDDTLMFNKSDCDIVIENHGTLPEFYEKLAALCRLMQLSVG